MAAGMNDPQLKKQARGSPVRVLAASQLFRVEDSKSFALVVRADSPIGPPKTSTARKSALPLRSASSVLAQESGLIATAATRRRSKSFRFHSELWSKHLKRAEQPPSAPRFPISPL
jgi:hypothetical protein